jgi:two-component system cell cycle sensor histidine kinase/response regulator CckA
MGATPPFRTGDPRLPDGAEAILVVDDEPAVRRLVVSSLLRDGHRVLEAGSAVEARLVAMNAHVDLLLTDATMPGESGLELAQSLVAERPHLIVVIMSGFTEESLTIDAARSPAAVLHKPFTPTELRGRIRQILDSARDNKLHRRS